MIIRKVTPNREITHEMRNWKSQCEYGLNYKDYPFSSSLSACSEAKYGMRIH